MTDPTKSNASDRELQQTICHLAQRLNQTRQEIRATLNNIERQLREQHQPSVHPVTDGLSLLLKGGFERVQAFRVLLQNSPTAAVTVLREAMFHPAINPDKRSGSYTSDLELMLSDWVEHFGSDALADFFRHLALPQKVIEDPRVVSSVAFALDIDQDEAQDWLNTLQDNTDAQ